MHCSLRLAPRHLTSKQFPTIRYVLLLQMSTPFLPQIIWCSSKCTLLVCQCVWPHLPNCPHQPSTLGAPAQERQITHNAMTGLYMYWNMVHRVNYWSYHHFFFFVRTDINVYVAVLCRNRPSRISIASLPLKRCIAELPLRAGRSYALRRFIRYSCIYEARVWVPPLTEVQRYSASNAAMRLKYATE